ncbi:type II toxin-antitoxin system HicA family toxin [Candidatus Peregrinibacteria bacterium]|nr:type II toxin-antitoxin system HicA family toxin [Candidatus Peregrinibacteria bacterium]
MPKLISIKPKKLIKILISIGFVERDAQGSHVFFKHKDGRTTVVPVHNRELSKGLLRKILNDVQLLIEEYEKLRK